MRYRYSCAGCGSSVSKPAVSMDEKNEERLHGLHGWKCSGKCNGPVKVKRTLAPKE